MFFFKAERLRPGGTGYQSDDRSEQCEQGTNSNHDLLLRCRAVSGALGRALVDQIVGAHVVLHCRNAHPVTIRRSLEKGLDVGVADASLRGRIHAGQSLARLDLMLQGSCGIPPETARRIEFNFSLRVTLIHMLEQNRALLGGSERQLSIYEGYRPRSASISSTVA